MAHSRPSRRERTVRASEEGTGRARYRRGDAGDLPPMTSWLRIPAPETTAFQANPDCYAVQRTRSNERIRPWQPAACSRNPALGCTGLQPTIHTTNWTVSARRASTADERSLICTVHNLLKLAEAQKPT